MQEMSLDGEILEEYQCMGSRSILVEGFKPGEYEDYVGRFKEKFKKYFKPSLSLDFLKTMEEPIEKVVGRLKNKEHLFVYNLDLFGKGVDPDKATEVMKALRAEGNYNSVLRQLLFARPEADLDYNSISGYTYRDNHPLGNWCRFFYIKNKGLIRLRSPIRHRMINE